MVAQAPGGDTWEGELLSFACSHPALPLRGSGTREGPGPGKNQEGPGGGTSSLPARQPSVGVTGGRGLPGRNDLDREVRRGTGQGQPEAQLSSTPQSTGLETRPTRSWVGKGLTRPREHRDGNPKALEPEGGGGLGPEEVGGLLWAVGGGGALAFPPPLAEGCHGLQWLKVTPRHLTGLVRLLPSQLVGPGARLLRGPQAGLRGGWRETQDHPVWTLPRQGPRKGAVSPLAGNRQRTCPRRSPRGLPPTPADSSLREGGGSQPQAGEREARTPCPRPEPRDPRLRGAGRRRRRRPGWGLLPPRSAAEVTFFPSAAAEFPLELDK